MSDYAAVQEQLTQTLPTLPKTLQLAATYMLDHPGDIATLSMRKVAENAKVTVPNFDRLAKTLGFGTYGELRQVYQQHVQDDENADYHLRARKLQQSGDEDGYQVIWSDLNRSAKAHIERVYGARHAGDIARIAEMIAASPRIFVAGAQASRSVATYLTYVGRMASPKFRLVGRTEGLFADDLAEMLPGDTLIAIAIRPCARPTIEAAKIASERECRVVGITDSRASPLAAYCDELLLTPTESPMFFESYIGILATVELLLTFLTMKFGDAAVTRIEEIEAHRARLGEYWKQDD